MSSERTLDISNFLKQLNDPIKTSSKILDYNTVKCSIVSNGLTNSYATYYLCECDPERKNPICAECFQICHKGKGHGQIKQITGEKICQCGIKSHQPFYENDNKDLIYKKVCLFGEWISEGYCDKIYKDSKNHDLKICILCKNLCFKNSKNFIKTNPANEGMLPHNFKCLCNHNNHNDIRIMFRKFKSISKKNNFNIKYDFDEYTFNHIINFILRGKNSFENIFHSFQIIINNTIKKIDSDNKYRLEDFKTINDLHLTSQILNNFAIKAKNVYLISNFYESFNPNNTLNFSDRKKNGRKKLSLFSIEFDTSVYEPSQNIYINGRTLTYFRKDIQKILTTNIYFKIMSQKFDFKSHNIWQLKYYLTNIFWTFKIETDFIKYPNLKYKDLFLLNPYQRIYYINSIKKENYINIEYLNPKYNFLDNILVILSKIQKTQEKYSEIYLIYNRLYKICQLFAKFSLFSFKQVEKFCMINDDILLFFYTCIQEDKKSSENQHLKYKVLSPMMKCIVYLAYYFNDQVLLSSIKNEKNINFLHMKNEIIKLLINNVESCLSLIQDLTPEYDIETYKKEEKIQNEKIKKNKKKNYNHFHNNNNNNNNNNKSFIYYDNNNMKKCLRNIVKSAHSVLNLLLNLPDMYMLGLHRLIHKYSILQYNYAIQNYELKENNILKNFKKIYNNIENLFFNFYDDYNSDEFINELNNKLDQIILQLKINDISGNENENDRIKNKHNLGSLATETGRFIDSKTRTSLDHNIINNHSNNFASNLKKNPDLIEYQLIFRRIKPREFNYNNINNKFTEKDKIKILVNNTYLINSIFKSIQILYYNFVSKYPKDIFKLNEELFAKILKISYYLIDENIDNSYLFLTYDFTSSIELLNEEQLFNMLDVIQNCLENIYIYSMEISTNSQLFHLLKVAVIKSSSSIFLIDKILKIMDIITKINFNDEPNTLRKFRKLFINFYDKITEAKLDLKMLVKYKDNVPNYKIFKKTLRIINFLFAGNAVLEERRFIEELLSHNDFTKIFRNNILLDISIRTELLVLYRIIYIDTITMKGKINYYTSFLINEPKVPKTDGFIENQKYLRFYENLITGGTTDYSNHKTDRCCNYLFELQNFKNIINRASHNTPEKTRDYFERGLIKPLMVFKAKFSSLVFHCTGVDYLRFYLLLIFFLRLKIYIIEKKDNLFFDEKRKTFKNPFKNSLNYMGKKKKSILNLNFTSEDYKNLNEDIENVNSPNFKLVYFYIVNDYFQKNTIKFIKEEKINKGLKDYFEKKNVVYEDDEIEKKKNFLSKVGLINSKYKERIFNIIIKYVNSKTKFETCSFFKTLSDDNIFYNCKFREVVVRNILFFMNNFNYEGTYRETCMWYLFRLLQYDTSETQKACLEISEKKADMLNFDYFLEDFTLHVMSIFTRKLNPCKIMIRRDYFRSLMIIKILKYFCEEHNQEFQRIFFKKEEDDGIVLHYNPKLYESELNNQGYLLWKQDDVEQLPDILNADEEDIQIEFDDDSLYTNSDGFKNKKPIPDEECENFHELTRSEDNLREIQKNKASVFEYGLSILGKIILVSNWINNKDSEELNDYYYDLYFVILEFLIETIQGTKSENLETVFVKDSNGKNLFGTFLLDINRLMIEENDDELSYQVRKDMMDFLMAFIEESETPTTGIIEISSVILPISILESILITMSKLFEINMLKEEQKKKKEKTKENYRTKMTSITVKNSFVDNKNHTALDQSKFLLTNKKIYRFTPEMKKYFTEKFFKDKNLLEDIKFNLANRMYQFFKFFGIEDEFKNPAVSEFYEKMNLFHESKIEKYYYSNKINDKILGITDPKFFDNYLCVSFFESITKMVFVNKIGNKKPARVLFTINPVVPLLSQNSKIDFIESVDRSNRYNKLFALTESCDYFFEEVSYKHIHGTNSAFVRFITNIDFYYIDFFSFLITFAINIILVLFIKGEGERLYGEPSVDKYISGLGLANLIINIISLILWMQGKFQLFYLTECQKILKQKQNKTILDDDEVHITLSIFDKIYATFIVLIIKNKIFGFIWNISFSAAAFFTKIYFLYILQLYSIITLSITLKNLIFSVVYKFNQLMSVFYLTIILNFIFSVIAFFHFSRDFIREIPIRAPYDYPSNFDFLNEILGSPYQEQAHSESECGTLLYCFATHLDYGMRFDGGIADRMHAASYTHHKSYYLSRFFYEDFYFICLVILMLNMIFGIIIEAFGDLRQKEQQINKDKKEICFICGVDKDTLEKKGEKLDVHREKVHNIWTYVDYILGLRFVDIQETNSINSYVIESLEKKELNWFPYDESAIDNTQNNEDDE